ncbi:hypothetical protein D3C84_775600 [compost metagenome]
MNHHDLGNNAIKYVITATLRKVVKMIHIHHPYETPFKWLTYTTKHVYYLYPHLFAAPVDPLLAAVVSYLMIICASSVQGPVSAVLLRIAIQDVRILQAPTARFSLHKKSTICNPQLNAISFCGETLELWFGYRWIVASKLPLTTSHLLNDCHGIVVLLDHVHITLPFRFDGDQPQPGAGLAGMLG